LIGADQVAVNSARTSSREVIAEREPIKPLPLTVNADPRKVALGEKLFHEKMLSQNNTVSCASCHNLKKGGVDGRPRSVGMTGDIVDFNSPTVFNSGFNFKQFWDGRANTLEEQVEGPVTAAAEMGSNWNEVLRKLRASPEYVKAFNAVYTGGVQRDNVKDAIATFERSLITPNARFDRYLRGDRTAISDVEKRGYSKFKSLGCVSCHQGVNVGGNMFETFGATVEYFVGSTTNKADLGRFNVTGREADKYVFKVPGLRNVALTAPYFHDGSAETLEEAVQAMGRYQLGRPLSQEDVDDLVSFLKTLTGEYQGRPL